MAKNDNSIIELLNSITENLDEYKNSFSYGRLTSINYPIYYFFDKNIYEKIGATIESRNKIREYYDLDKIFNLNSKNIINIYNIGHSTILYKLEINNKKYIYYSNSGLGINNNIRYDGNIIAKIFYISNNKILNNLCNNINDVIKIIVDPFESIKISDFNTDEELISIIHKLIIKEKIFSKIKEHEICYIYNNVSLDKTKNGILLCYALLYYISSKYSDDFKECSIYDIGAVA